MSTENVDLVTLTRHLLASEKKCGGSGDLTLLLASIQLGCKFVAMSVRKAGIAKLTGLAGAVNVQGEEVKKLDLIANEVFINALVSSGKCSVLVSEELDNAVIVQDEKLKGPYVVVFDPLDGSSNIDAGVSIGTIFGIYKLRDGSKGSVEDALRPGSQMVAAGYAMYGSSTQLVLSHGHGVDGYTLDPALGEFILTHEQIRIPERGKIYSVNEGNSVYWDKPTSAFVAAKKNPPQESGAKPYSLRYIGSMVADVHRTLLYGGLFMYPADSKSKNGKLRVLYECFPMGFLCEQAGGRASTGTLPMLDLDPQDIHQRSPIFLGSKLDVEDLEKLYKELA